MLGSRFAILKVRSRDPDLQRKGRVLAIMLLGMAAAGVVLAVFNIFYGDTQYNIANALFISSALGLYILNRFGFVHAVGLFIVILTAVGSFSLDNPTAMYAAMTIPVFIASYLIVSWSGFVVAALMVAGTMVFGVTSLSLVILGIVAVIAYLLADSLDRAYRENHYRAFHDDLTDLPNRALFTYRLQRAVERTDRDRSLCAVLFMDLDQFKVVNDSLGHEFGDELLIAVGRRLRACLRSGDIAARFGGDEFAVLLDDVADASYAVRVAERIVKTIEVPFELKGRQIFISTSVGIALIGQDDDRKPDDLLRGADIAMYEAKKEGKGYCKVFSSDMYARALERLELENDLRRAIERGELRVYYQPKVLLSTCEITGMESLVRWEHPERGLIFPEEFIPLAEETGLIIPLGRWMLRETCRQAREWQMQYPTASLLAMSVNLSVKQFKELNLVREIAEALKESEMEPRSLQLEITESVLADNVEYAVDLLQKLKGLGIRLAMDDFGTGYSSLTTLQRFPLDELKVDRAFVGGLGKNTQDVPIVKLVVDLAHAMGLQALAEGVETTEQLAQLRSMGCDQGQGHYFCKPLAAEAATTLLADPPRWLTGGPDSAEPFRSPRALLEGRRYPDPR